MNKAVTKRVAMHGTGREYLRRLSADIRRDRWLYALLVPGVVYFLVFKYLPMWGVVMAFENYVPFSGVFGSEWVGISGSATSSHRPRGRGISRTRSCFR